MAHDMAKITGIIKTVNGLKDDWDFIFDGKLVEPVGGPDEKFSLFMNKKTRKSIHDKPLVLLRIKDIKLSDTGVSMIIFEGGIWQSKNTLFVGPSTLHLLANKLCPSINPITSSVQEKVNMLSAVLKHKQLYLEFKPAGTTLKPEEFLGTEINLTIDN